MLKSSETEVCCRDSPVGVNLFRNISQEVSGSFVCGSVL